MPNLLINLKKITKNTRTVIKKASGNNIQVVGVTKGVLGDSQIAKAMIRGGVAGLTDSHPENLTRLKKLGLPLIMLRQPTKSQASEVIKLTDTSLIATVQAASWLSKEAVKQKKRHGLILMLETGDFREGVLPYQLDEFVRQLATLPSVYIQGIGTNVACLKQMHPSKKNLDLLVKAVKKLKAMVDFSIVSGGNSSAWPLLETGNMPPEINQLRIGEAILLGNETVNYQPIKDTSQDTFILEAEIIEVNHKPTTYSLLSFSKPKKTIKRVILATGLQDIGCGRLSPLSKQIRIKRVSSDHLVAEVSSSDLPTSVGSKLCFIPSYFALLALMTSPFVRKVYW